MGHGSEEHIRHPRLVEALTGKRVVSLSLGIHHCLATTEDGEIYAWGKNDKGQLGEGHTGTKVEPSLIAALQSKHIIGTAAGPAQSFAWSCSPQGILTPRIPFVVDICRATFEHLDALLCEVCEGLDGTNDWPPPQEKECMAVAALNLLNLQMYAAICQGSSPESIGLLPGSALVDSLKQRLVALASNSGVIVTVQRAAQSVLLNGWSLLLPTAEERAKALSNLLPSGKLRRGLK